MVQINTIIAASMLAVASANPKFLVCDKFTGTVGDNFDGNISKMGAGVALEAPATPEECLIQAIGSPELEPCGEVEIKVSTTVDPATGKKIGYKTKADAGSFMGELVAKDDAKCGDAESTAKEVTFKYKLPASGDAKIKTACVSFGSTKSYAAELMLTVDTEKTSKCESDNSGASTLGVSGLVASIAAFFALR